MYIKRIIDSSIDSWLESIGFILITGPKWCGKTMTSRQHSKSKIEILTPAQKRKIEIAVDMDDFSIFDGESPMLIDEWQAVPGIWDLVKCEVDKREKPGQFILTGSSVSSNVKTLHSGTGRVAKLRMYPMSLYESGESNGSISLKSIFEGNDKVHCESTITIDQLAKTIIRGGWPAAVSYGENNIGDTASQYVKNVIDDDVGRALNLKVERTDISKMVRSIARNISMNVNLSLLAREGGDDVTEYIASKCVKAMNEMFFLENLDAWNTHVRSGTRLSTKPKWEFCDPSLAAAALSIDSNRLFDDFDYFGLLFESLCLRDIRVYSQALDGNVFFFKDNADGHEIDFIIELRNGDWGAIEVKMGSAEEDKAANNLNKLTSKMDPKYVREPKFKMILTAGKYGYRRRDGVLVVPIGCLKD